MDYPNLVAPAHPVVLSGRFVELRPFTAKDVVDTPYVGWLNDPEVNRYLECRHHRHTVESAVAHINNCRHAKREFFGIWLKQSQQLIGTTSLPVMDAHGTGIFGYGLMIGDAGARGKGIGLEVQVLLLEWLFRHVGMRRGSLLLYAANPDTCNIVEHLGFALEGRLREHILLDDGSYCDGLYYGMFRPEWDTHREKFLPFLKHFTHSGGESSP